ncbi:MAG: Uma2 family endonuclease [Acidimicrobiales bacterium]
MKAVLLEVPAAIRDVMKERERLGLDHHDEMWEGVLHMVPPAAEGHQRTGGRLIAVLLPAADAAGLRLTYETGLYRANKDYRVPDLIAYRPEVATHRGVEGPPELVVEIRSPGDESYEKLGWYFALGTRQVCIIERDTLDVELHEAEGRVAPDSEGWLTLSGLGVRVRSVLDGLEVDAPGGLVLIHRP